MILGSLEKKKYFSFRLKKKEKRNCFLSSQKTLKVFVFDKIEEKKKKEERKEKEKEKKEEKKMKRKWKKNKKKEMESPKDKKKFKLNNKETKFLEKTLFFFFKIIF